MVGEVVFWQDVLRHCPSQIHETMNSAENLICNFFVYGTLCRGQCRANLWPAAPQKIVPAWVSGELFGRKDYPAMRPGTARIAGECWQFDQIDVPTVIRALDRIEGTNQPGAANLYDRVLLKAFPLERFGDEILHSVDHRQDPGSNFPDSGVLAYGYHYAIDPREHGFCQIRPSAEDSLCRWPG